MHAPVLVTAADANDPIITTAAAKLHCRIDGTDDDTLVAALVSAATAHLDGYTGTLGRALVTQTWRQDFDCFYPCLRLPLPAATITEVRWFAEDDATGSVISATNYELQADALGSLVRFDDDYAFPGTLADWRGVRVTFTAGYGDATEVPAAIRQAMLLLVGHWYMNREAVNVGNITTELPMAVAALLAPYRRVGI